MMSDEAPTTYELTTRQLEAMRETERKTYTTLSIYAPVSVRNKFKGLVMTLGRRNGGVFEDLIKAGQAELIAYRGVLDGKHPPEVVEEVQQINEKLRGLRMRLKEINERGVEGAGETLSP